MLIITYRDTSLSKQEIIKLFIDNKQLFFKIQAHNGDYNDKDYLDMLSQFQKVSNGHGVSRAGDMIWFGK